MYTKLSTSPVTSLYSESMYAVSLDLLVFLSLKPVFGVLFHFMFYCWFSPSVLAWPSLSASTSCDPPWLFPPASRQLLAISPCLSSLLCQFIYCVPCVTCLHSLVWGHAAVANSTTGPGDANVLNPALQTNGGGASIGVLTGFLDCAPWVTYA